MAKLAIKGHPTRGSEVIALLGTLRGNNANNCYGKYCDRVYYINENGYIDQDFISHIEQDTKFIIYTLEEFEQKFPFKVGDKVIYRNNIFCIKSAQWDSGKNTVIYYIDADWSAGYVVKANDLQLYKEETIEESTNKAIFEGNSQSCDIMNDIIKKDMGQIKIDIPEGYKFDGIDDNNKIVFTKIQPQYPKTYVECAKILNCFSAAHIDGYKNELFEKLQELIICRDAYWKIAGEELGLSKPWNPNWTTLEGMPAIVRFRYNIVYDFIKDYQCLLIFPTEEMRDAFYENFKELIETVKELL